MQRLDIGDLADLEVIAPGEEPSCSPVIGHAGVLVADGGGKEFEEAPGGLVAGGGDNAGHKNAIAGRDRERLGLRNDDLSIYAG